MEIKYIKERTVLIKGKKENVLIDPGKSIPDKSRPRVVIFTIPELVSRGSAVNEVLIAGPGEYEVGGVEINGYSAGNGVTFYTMVVDGVNIGVVGKLEEFLSDKKIDKVTGIDVLLVDVNNEKNVGTKKILELAKKWGANYVVPVGESEDESMKKFVDEADAEGGELSESLKVDKDNLPDGTEVVLLKPSSL